MNGQGSSRGGAHTSVSLTFRSSTGSPQGGQRHISSFWKQEGKKIILEYARVSVLLNKACPQEKLVNQSLTYGGRETPNSVGPAISCPTKGKTKQIDRTEKHIVKAAAQTQGPWKRTGQHCPHWWRSCVQWNTSLQHRAASQTSLTVVKYSLLIDGKFKPSTFKF